MDECYHRSASEGDDARKEERIIELNRIEGKVEVNGFPLGGSRHEQLNIEKVMG